MLTNSASRILLLVAVLLLVCLVPFSSSSFRSAEASPPTAISPTDGTGSPASLGTIITSGTSIVPTPLCTAECVITGGTRAGDNLFHSFGDFNIGALDSARFQTGLVNPLPDASVSNILARVTGGSSSLYGSLDSATYYPSANLFLLNPAGFLFGPNATVNVGGMMTFTTADYMRLTDSGRFNANATPLDMLTAAPVAAFGFLGSSPAAINFEGGQLTVAQGTGVTLVGGDINLVPDISDSPSGITAPGRLIRLTSVGGPGEVAADTAVPKPGMALGNITLGEGTILSTVGDPTFGNGSGGAVSIRGGQFVATDAQILTGPAVGSLGQGGTVTIATTDSASFTNSFIDTSSIFAGGNAGAITVAGSQVNLQDTFLMARVEGDGTTTGSGGAVTLTGTIGVSLTGSIIATDTFSSNGNGGAVTLMAPIVSLEEGSFINTGVLGDGITPITANGGAVTLAGTTSVSLQRATISTESVDTEGNSGAVTITTPTVTIVGIPGQQTINTSTQSTTGDPNAGHGGDIEITGTNVTLTAARIESSAASPGTFSRGGDIRITGSENILIDNGTALRTTTTSQGNAGNMDLVGQHVTIKGQSTLLSETLGPGSGGTIRITGGENIAIESASKISTTSAFAVDNQGPAGDIELTTQQLTVTGGSQISSSTYHNGAGGNITILAGQSVTLNNKSSISANSYGSGNAGNILINAGQNYTSTDSEVTTQAEHASGGNITVLATDTVQLTNSQLNASVQGSSTTVGGNITIDPQYVILQNSHILAEATQGQGGAISITITNGGLFLPDANSAISASSQFGVNGTVTIQSPNAPASGQIQPLGKTPLQATSLLNQHCAALADGQFSSFTVAGRDSLPTGPGNWLTSPLALATRSEGMGVGVKAEGVKAEGMSASAGQVASGQWRVGDTPILSLRQIAPAGFLTQAFAVDWSASCES